MWSLNCNGKPVYFDRTALMGIINITDDSFYAGSRQTETDLVVRMARDMVDNGADFIDIGGQSSRPGSLRISAEEEMQRVLPALEAIRKQLPDALISVDTFYADVAKACIQAGASMINDISAGTFDQEMIPLIAEMNVPYCCMHMRGRPENMNSYAHYENVTAEVFDYLAGKIHYCREQGIKDIIIDPGFGFAKNSEHNFRLLRELSAFQILGCPVLVGVSRKSMIYKTLDIGPEEALPGTLVLQTLAVEHGADILRVHDVKEAVHLVKLMETYKKAAR